MGKRGPKPRGTVVCTWSPALAYCVGLLTADGCLLNDGRHIDLTSADREQIEHFQQALGLYHVKIGKKTSGSISGKRYYRIQFGDVLFYQWLQSIGLSPNKSKTIAELNIPDEYFFDFFRGLFDGDGSVHAFWDTRWLSSYVYWLSITSASPLFILWLQKRCYELIRIRGSINKSVRAQELRFAKNATRVLVTHMYPSANIPYLQRKFAKLQKVFSIDDVHKCASGEIW